MAVTSEDYERLALECDRLAHDTTDAHDLETLSGMAYLMRLEAGRKDRRDAGSHDKITGAFARLKEIRARGA